jgi:outer membrane protein
MKKTLLTLCAATLLSSTAYADAIGVYAGAQVWNSDADGLFGEQNQQIDFNLDTKTKGSYFLALEHPLPFIPNAKISVTNLDTEGLKVLANDFDFGGQSFPAGSSAASTLDISYIDYTLYYELFDNDLLTFDFGLTVRDIDADITVDATVSNSTISGNLNGTAYIPMAYASLIFGIPSTDFNIFAEGNFLSFDSQTLYDYQAGVSYELVENLAVDVNVNVGYRAVKLELDDIDNLYTNLDFTGVFAGVVVHF